MPAILCRVRKAITSFSGHSAASSDNRASNLSASLLRSVTTSNHALNHLLSILQSIIIITVNHHLRKRTQGPRAQPPAASQHFLGAGTVQTPEGSWDLPFVSETAGEGCNELVNTATPCEACRVDLCYL